MIRILIVEDDENISKMLAATLSIGDYEYDRCADGEEAVQTILNGTYDLILLDVMLPGMDGFAVLEHIRGESCETPVIFLTALGAVADKVKGLRGGAEDYIVKPFEPVELVAGMRKPTVSLVLGGGHSIGVPLAVAAKHSFIAPSASMTIHPVRMSGLMLGVPQTLEYFQRMQDRITNFVTANSGISYERFMQLAMNTQELVMDVGTVLDGDEAVAEGLIDTLGSLHDAMDCLDKMIAAEKNKQRAKPRKGKKSL